MDGERRIDWKEAARYYRTLYGEAIERGCHDRDFWRGRTFEMQAAIVTAEARVAELERALCDIQFDLINCHEAASRNACEHIKDAIKIVNAALAQTPAVATPAPAAEREAR